MHQSEYKLSLVQLCMYIPKISSVNDLDHVTTLAFHVYNCTHKQVSTPKVGAIMAHVQ